MQSQYIDCIRFAENIILADSEENVNMGKVPPGLKNALQKLKLRIHSKKIKIFVVRNQIKYCY